MDSAESPATTAAHGAADPSSEGPPSPSQAATVTDEGVAAVSAPADESSGEAAPSATLGEERPAARPT
jgi:hypothetical protein